MPHRTHRLTLHDLELEVTYDYSPAYAGRGPTMNDSGGEPAEAAGATVTAVHVVDPVVERLRKELRALWQAVRDAGYPVYQRKTPLDTACRQAGATLTELANHVGPELSDDWFDRGETYRDLLREVVYGEATVPLSLRARIMTALAMFTDPRSQMEEQLIEHEADADADAREQAAEDRYEAARESGR